MEKYLKNFSKLLPFNLLNFMVIGKDFSLQCSLTTE
jgi:hypothetical protein